MQHKIKSSLIMGVGLFAIATTGFAAELTANVGVTSNYVFRGETQTQDDPAVQGGVDYSHDSGFYAGTWASNVDFPGADGFEIDLYAGYNFKLNESVNFDVGYITYQYTDSALSDIDEIYFGASFKDLSVTYYDGNIDNGSDYSYIDIKYSFALQKDFNLHLHYGNLDSDAANSDAEDISIGISKLISEFDVSLTATSIDRDRATNSDDTELFLTVTKSFDIKI